MRIIISVSNQITTYFHLLQGFYQNAVQNYYNTVVQGMDFKKEVARLTVQLASSELLMTNETLSYGSGF